MYIFKIDKKEELLSGRTIKYVASKIGISIDHLSKLLKGKHHCSKAVAYCLTKLCNENYEIEYFFERIR